MEYKLQLHSIGQAGQAFHGAGKKKNTSPGKKREALY
jgi:hypothetical protein